MKFQRKSKKLLVGPGALRPVIYLNATEKVMGVEEAEVVRVG